MSIAEEVTTFDLAYMQWLAGWVWQVTPQTGKNGRLADMITTAEDKSSQLKINSAKSTRRHTATETAPAGYSTPLIHPDDYAKSWYIKRLRMLCPEYIGIVEAKYHRAQEMRARGRISAHAWVMDAARRDMPGRTAMVRARIGQFANLMLEAGVTITEPWKLGEVRMSREVWNVSSDKKHWHEARRHLYALEGEALRAWWDKIAERR